jgi:arginine decarboxylase
LCFLVVSSTNPHDAPMPKTRSPRAQKIDQSETAPLLFVPRRVFFTSGVGRHEQERVATQHAMAAAGVPRVNLVKISSVIAPRCQIISRQQGIRLLRSGSIVFAVIAQGMTKEPHQRVTPAIAWSKPEDENETGFIAEVEEQNANGLSEKAAEDRVGEEALILQAAHFGVKVNAERAWAGRGRSRSVRLGGKRVRVGSLCASIVGAEAEEGEEQYSTAVVLAVFL